MIFQVRRYDPLAGVRALKPYGILATACGWIVLAVLPVLFPATGPAHGSHLEWDPQVDVDQNIPRGKRAGGHDVAVVIGNRDYGDLRIPKVESALHDARTMREYLVMTLGFDPGRIIFEENIGHAGLVEIFGDGRGNPGKLPNFIKAGESRLFIYYVGHSGPVEPSIGRGHQYLLPTDAARDNWSEGYGLQTFFENLAGLHARDITVVLDAFFYPDVLFKSLLENAAMTVFFSTNRCAISKRLEEKQHSLFAYFLFRGLRGEADANHDKTITVGELKQYFIDEADYFARRKFGRSEYSIVIGDETRVIAILE